MCLLDTIDGALMMALYISTTLAKDRIAILYYSIVLTVVTVIVAVVIGIIQLLSLIQNVAEPSGRFWAGVEVAGDHYDVIGLYTDATRHHEDLLTSPGGGICGSFLVFGGLSILLYKPWRRWFDERRLKYQQFHQVEEAANTADIVPPPTNGSGQPSENSDLSTCPPGDAQPVICRKAGSTEP